MARDRLELTRTFALCLGAFACTSTKSIETAPIEASNASTSWMSVLASTRERCIEACGVEIDRVFDNKKLSLDQWTCLAHSLERMDAGLRAACSSGEAQARSVLLQREQEAAACMAPTDP